MIEKSLLYLIRSCLTVLSIAIILSYLSTHFKAPYHTNLQGLASSTSSVQTPESTPQNEATGHVLMNYGLTYQAIQGGYTVLCSFEYLDGTTVQVMVGEVASRLDRLGVDCTDYLQ